MDQTYIMNLSNRKTGDLSLESQQFQYKILKQFGSTSQLPTEFDIKTFTIENNIEISLPSKYEYTKILGKGTYGIVIEAIDLENQTSVAIKKINLIGKSNEYLKRELREIKILRKIDHPNVIKIKNVFLSENNEEIDSLYIVFEKFGIDLTQFMQSKNKQINSTDIKRIMLQIALGIQHLHINNILHRDIKPENILIDEQLNIKICDFGLAIHKLRDRRVQCSLHCYVASRWYRAPELLLLDDDYSLPVDIWGLGCLFAEMIRGRQL